MCETVNISLTQGDTLKFYGTMMSGSGDALDITGFTFRVGILIDGTVHKKEVSTHIDPVNGVMGDIKFLPSETILLDTGTWQYDIEYEDTNGDVYTFRKGKIVINEQYAGAV